MICQEEKYKKLKKELVKFLKNEGIEVYTNTKALGNQGFFRHNRIDISKSITPQRACQVIAHEYAHFIHYQIKPEMLINSGSLEKIFLTSDIQKIEEELIFVTDFVAKNSAFEKLYKLKEKITYQIKEQEKIIKQEFPDFQHTKKFVQFDKFIKKHKAKFFLKYDRVKYITPFLRRVEFYNIKNIDEDFSDIPQSFRAYLKMQSFKRARNRINNRICKMKKYYNRPNELFARFIESLTIDYEHTKNLAPTAFARFEELTGKKYFANLKKLIEKIICFD